MPPAPIGPSTSYGPSRVPATSGMGGAIIRRLFGGPVQGSRRLILPRSLHLPTIPFAGKSNSDRNKISVRLWIDSSSDENREIGERALIGATSTSKQGR